MTQPRNPALHEEPINQPTSVVVQPESSLLDWLEASGRLIDQETTTSYLEGAMGAEPEELSEFIDGSDTYDIDAFDDDDDDFEAEI